MSVDEDNFRGIHPSVTLSFFQAQFRLAAQRLGQLQEKFESHAQVTKGDIGTLLRQGNVGLARAKAEGVIKDEIHSDLLQTLEMYLGVVLEQFAEIEKKYFNFCPLPRLFSPIGRDQVNSKSSTCRSCIRNYLCCPYPWYSRYVCASDPHPKPPNNHPKNCKWPVKFSFSGLARNLPAQQLGIKIVMSLRGCVAVITLQVPRPTLS